jgi:hypothetical protein
VQTPNYCFITLIFKKHVVEFAALLSFVLRSSLRSWGDELRDTLLACSSPPPSCCRTNLLSNQPISRHILNLPFGCAHKLLFSTYPRAVCSTDVTMNQPICIVQSLLYTVPDKLDTAAPSDKPIHTYRNELAWPTWDVGVLSGMRDVETYNRGRPS